MNQETSEKFHPQIIRPEDRVEITYYTDPLCCWSWAMEPQWRRFRYEFGDQVRWKYCMGGLIPNWQTYSDPMNSVERPAQMGPLWMDASQVSGMPIADSIWSQNPPASSYPACIAVKTAGLQSPQALELYLRAVRESLMLDGNDISQKEVLFDVAASCETRFPKIFDASLFIEQFDSEASRLAFKEDLMKVRFHKIGRYPTLTMSKPAQKGVIITGYRPYDVLLQAVLQVAPSITPINDTKNLKAYINYWGKLTNREIKEVSSIE